MKDQFVPYKLAVKLKEIGFDEECFAFYISSTELQQGCLPYVTNKSFEETPFSNYPSAPLWQQAFAFLLRNIKNRELYAALEFDGEVTLMEVVTEDTYETYNKTLASGNKESLEKLIELCKKK